jgi:membrane-bound serine protease (ClpP class)
VTGAQGLLGAIGTARTALSPDGKVFIHGELWDAVASGNIDAGQTVVVKRIDGLRLEVEPVPAAQPSGARTLT